MKGPERAQNRATLRAEASGRRRKDRRGWPGRGKEDYCFVLELRVPSCGTSLEAEKGAIVFRWGAP